MGCVVGAMIWGGWCIGVVLVVKEDPTLYPAAAAMVSGAALFFLGNPGLLTLLGRTDFSGKGGSTLPSGCLPVTVALDLATAPLQLPLLLPFAVVWLRDRREQARRQRSAQESPEATSALIARVGKWLLEDRQYVTLVEKSREKSAIRREEIPTLVDLFFGEIDGRSSASGLLALIENQPVSDGDLRRIFRLEHARDADDRSPDVLAALAVHPDTPTDVLRGICALGAPDEAVRVAYGRLDAAGRGGPGPQG